ncbi:MAG TPA: co-chaperone YbbN [Burkholderiales bacterium]|nr:co-chaperone YbbN [Burkholderiales bacterium]
MTAHVTEVSEDSFQRGVIEESENRLVLVDFWAPWCGPCRSLTPIIEKLAGEFGGRFLLAKINSDENPSIASEFGVRGIPNVKAFSEGKLIDEFTGALPEGMVRQFIERLLPSRAEEKRRVAVKTYRSGQAAPALVQLDEAQALEPANDTIRIDRAEVLIALGRAKDAAALLDELAPLAAMDARVEHLKAQLTFAVEGDSEEKIEALEAQLLKNPGDLDARLALAKSCVAAKQFEPALKHLIEIIRVDRSFGDDAGRKTMLAVFEILGNDHHLTSQYRRLLAASLN